MPVSTVDVAATILELVGRDAPNQPLDGASLLPLVEGSTESRPLFADTKASGIQGLYAEVDQSAALLEDVKCIHSGNGIDRLSQPMTEDQAFDLAQDPEERRALHGSSAARRRCVELLAKRNAEVLPAEKRTVSQEPALEIDEEARDRLRALGYLE
jgi:arylsulfatase A-like enzyme